MNRHHHLAKCEECPLYDNGAYVPTEVNGTKLVIVGEAPGATEARAGRPFIGQSGKLLERTLEAHGIRRDDCTLTNTVSCRPRGNKDPDERAIRCCRPRLESEVEGFDTILATGNTAATAILGRKTKITKDRVGPPKISPRYPGSRVIATIHPAACLRVPDTYPNLVTDIGKINASAKTEWVNPEYKVFDEIGQAKIALNQILQRKELDPLAMDIEVGKEKDEDFGHPERLLSIAICYEESKVIVIGEHALQSPTVRDLLAQIIRSRRGIWHNAQYDLGVLYKLGIVSGRAYWDTMLASYVLDERGGTHGLKYLAKEILGAPDWDAELKEQGGFDDAPRDVLYRYNAYDAVATYRLYEIQRAHPEWDDDSEELNAYLLKAQHVLMHIAGEGIRIDTQALNELSQQLEKDIYESVLQLQPPEGLQAILEMSYGNDELSKLEILEATKSKFNARYFNPNSPKQVSQRLKQSFGISTKSTDKDHLLTIIEQIDKKLARSNRDIERLTNAAQFCRDILAYRKVGKLYGTYVKGVKTRLHKGRIHTTYLLHGTTTGRTSSRNINIQNVPRGEKIRKIYIPDDGNCFIQLDFKNIEGRIVFRLSNCESGRKILESGRDLHGEVARQIYGDNYDKEQRVKAKTVVHGVNYVRTPHGIAADPELGVTLNEANKLFKAYAELVPEVFVWHREMEKLIFSNQDLTTPFGRKRRFALVTRDNREDIYKEGIAFKPQSIASDITLHACIALWEAGFKIRNFIHDSVLIEAQLHEAEIVAKEAQKIMEDTAREVYTDWISFPVDYEIGRSWGELG